MSSNLNVRTVWSMAVAIAIAVTAGTASSWAKKPDWPGSLGSGVIGFGLVELTPVKQGDAYAQTEFTFNYDIPAAYAQNLGAGQIIVLPANAAEKYNDIPKSAFLAYESSRKTGPGAAFHMSAHISVSQPGLYMVAYGPWDGLLTFDTADGRESYKISAQAGSGGSLRWIDEDAGDLTVMNYSELKGVEAKETILRVRLLRDKRSILENKALFKQGTFQLNPKALERVKLIDANW